MDQIVNVSSNSSDEVSYCSMFEDECDNEMNKWFETFFYHVDQAVFYDKKLGENYTKIEEECKVWNNLFKLKDVDITDKGLQRTIFTTEKLGKNKPQLVEQTSFESGKYQLMRNKEKPVVQEVDDETKLMFNKPSSSKKTTTGNKAIATNNPYFELNDEFDKITLLNQMKQDYIRKHILNAAPQSTRSDGTGNQTPHNVLFPTNNNLNRRKQMMDQSKVIDESGCLYFYSNPNKKKDKKKVREDKTKVRSIKSIIKIDDAKNTNLILNSDHIVQPKTPIFLPPILRQKNESHKLQKYDNVTLREQNEAILRCDKSMNYCSLLNLRKNQELRAFNNKRPVMVSIEDNQFK